MFIKIAKDKYEAGIVFEIGVELDDLSVAALTASTIQHVSKGVTLVLAQKLKDERRRAMIAEAQDVAKVVSALNAVADTIDEEDREPTGGDEFTPEEVIDNMVAEAAARRIAGVQEA